MLLYCFEEKNEKIIKNKNGRPVKFRAKGIILAIQYPYDRDDGEVFAVLFEGANGKTKRAWKRPEEIFVYKMTEETWKTSYYRLTGSQSESEIICCTNEIELESDKDFKLIH